jgi:hypothetical protein
VYGVTSSGDIYYNADYKSGNWVKIPGGLSQVSFDGYNMVVMGVNSTGMIYYADKNIGTSPNWTQVPGGLSNLSYSNKQVYGVNSGNEIFYSADYKSGTWVKVPGGLSQVSFEDPNAFSKSTPMASMASMAPPAPPYDNNKVYQLGDMVTKDGQTYKMIDGIGAAGYPPPRPTNWQPVGSPTSSVPLYDNNKIYKLGDMVTKDGQTYKMIDGIGAAGYPPPRPTNWQPVGSSAPPPPMASMAPPPPPPMASMAPPAPPYDNNKVYKLGDMVTKDGQTYKMIDGIGAAGYPPPRPTNWQPVGSSAPSAPSAPPYDNNKVYQLGDMVSKDGQTYKMIDGIGAAGYPPPRPTNWQPVGSSAPMAPLYDNNKVYKLGDMVTKDGKTYRMIDGIGAAGYPPPRPTNWREI